MQMTLTLMLVLFFAAQDAYTQSAGLLIGRVVSSVGKALVGINMVTFAWTPFRR